MTDGNGPGDRVIRALLAFYPASFRARFGVGMAYSLARDLEAARRSGRRVVLGFWLRTFASLPMYGLLVRLRGGGRRVGVGSEGDPLGHAPAGGVARRSRTIASLVDESAREIRQSMRRLARSPGFVGTSLLTLGLGIGATASIYSVIDGVILRPLPYADESRLVVVGHASRTDVLGIPAAGWFHYRERAHTISDLAVYIESSASISGTGEPLELGIIQATPNLLGVLGVKPAMGRDLTDDDARPGAPSVVLVSHGYWVRHLGSDPDVIGKPVMEGEDEIVVGVLPADFEFERPPATVVFGNPFEVPDVIVPLRIDRSRAWFGNFMYQGVGRLAPGASPRDAEHELQGLMLEAAVAYPGGFTPSDLEDGGYRPRVVRFRDAIVGNLAGVLWILFGSVAFVLLIATANVANLFLLRAEVRDAEVSIRRALGATRGDLARTWLTESLLLATGGGILGVLLAATGTRALLGLAPTHIPRAEGVGVNASVLLFAAGLSVLAGIFLGGAPLLRRARSSGALGGRSRGATAGVRASAARRVLVTTQVAFALVLLAGSGLLLRTFRNLHDVDPGFDGSHTATLRLALSSSLLRAAGRTERAADVARSRFMLDLAARLEAIPGVQRASFSADLPLDGNEFHDFIAAEGRIPTGLEAAMKALRVFIGPGYLGAIGARLLRGRELEAREFMDQPRSVVVNRAFADSWFPGGDPIGQRLMQWAMGEDAAGDVWYTIVGVVDDIRETSLMQPAEPTVYLPTIFLPEGGFAMWVSNMIAVVRVNGDPQAMLPALRATVQAAYPEIPINGLATLDQVSARSYQQVSFAMTILLVAAALALGLGIVGIYGTVSWVVGQRTREFGLRIALGASGRDVHGEVLRSAAAIGATGIVIGLITALTATRVVQSLLFGVSAADPLVYAAVSLTLFVLVVIASLGPAARAAAADPADAMRTE